VRGGKKNGGGGNTNPVEKGYRNVTLKGVLHTRKRERGEGFEPKKGTLQRKGQVQGGKIQEE